MRSFIRKNGSPLRTRFMGVALSLAAAGTFLAACDSKSTEPQTDPNDEIVIQSPRGGEAFRVGDTLRVKWTLQGKGLTEVNAVNISLSPDSGKTWVGLLKKSIGLDDSLWGNYPWAIPVAVTHLGTTYDLPASKGLFLQIMQYSTADTNKIAVTKKPFTVSAR
ncbi:MAG TPA: hypothetical protein VJ385_15605 [Fibrobacteria bacterium]|nr:hypothetical protein [Fibrobacteria bacterium]